MTAPSFSTTGTENKKIDVQFTGGKLTSDAGVVLLHEMDRALKLTERINAIVHDPRDPVFTVHQQRDLIAQRIFSIALGYEDLNDQDTLRNDPGLLAAIKNLTDEERPLGSAPTLSRFENRITKDELAKLSRLPDEKPFVGKENTRYLVTNLEGSARYLYEDVYCARGDMENRIKEQQQMLFADRTSCHGFEANRFRLLLSSFAYVLLETMRRTALKGTKLEKAQCSIIRTKLLKIAAVVKESARRILFELPSSFPLSELWVSVAERLQRFRRQESG